MIAKDNTIRTAHRITTHYSARISPNGPVLTDPMVEGGSLEGGFGNSPVAKEENLEETVRLRP